MPGIQPADRSCDGVYNAYLRVMDENCGIATDLVEITVESAVFLFDLKND
jgi:hypothetical protein